MLENRYDWKISKADQNSNVYYNFPKDEDEFKEAVVKNGGMSVYIYQEGELMMNFILKVKVICGLHLFLIISKL